MPVPSALCTQQDIEDALGDPQVLVKLADARKTGMPYARLLATGIAFGTMRVLMAYGVRQQVQALMPPYPPALVLMAARFGAAEMWRVGAKGDAMPPQIAANEAICQLLCDQLIESKRNTATDVEPPNQQPMVVVDPDPDGVKVTTRTMKGFW